MKIYPPFSRAIGKTTLIALALFAAYAAFLLINGRSLSQNRWLKVNVSVQYLDDGMKLVLEALPQTNNSKSIVTPENKTDLERKNIPEIPSV
jgi:hypothetical protein